MLLQKARIGKTAVLIISLILFAVLAAMPFILQASTTAEDESSLFLPIIYNEYNEDDLTPEPGTESTPTATSIATSTAAPYECDLQFAKEAIGNSPYVLVTGDVGIDVAITNLSTNEVIGSGTLNGPIAGQDCPGFSYITVSPRLDETNIGDVLLAQQTDNPNNSDTTIVLGTNPQPTNTPSAPYLAVVPNCGTGPDVQFKVEGYNWPIDQSLTLFWEGTPQVTFQANQHSGFFIMTWTFAGLSEGTYTISTLSGTNGVSDSVEFYVSCDLVPTDTPSPTETPTSAPVDLVVGQPVLVSTPPITSYEPVAFQVPITNTGDLSIETLFFVDLLFEPVPTFGSETFTAVSGLAGNQTITLTITSLTGFDSDLGTHQVNAWVDSLDDVAENDETNNVSAPLSVVNVTPVNTPIPTAVPPGTATISGGATVLMGGTFLLQERMRISAMDQTTGLVVAVTYSDENGFYQFDNLTDEVDYTVQGCITIDNKEYFGFQANKTAPDTAAHIFAFEDPCP